MKAEIELLLSADNNCPNCAGDLLCRWVILHPEDLELAKQLYKAEYDTDLEDYQ